MVVYRGADPALGGQVRSPLLLDDLPSEAGRLDAADVILLALGAFGRIVVEGLLQVQLPQVLKQAVQQLLAAAESRPSSGAAAPPGGPLLQQQAAAPSSGGPQKVEQERVAAAAGHVGEKSTWGDSALENSGAAAGQLDDPALP